MDMKDFLIEFTSNLLYQRIDPATVRIYIPATAWDAFCRAAEEKWMTQPYMAKVGRIGDDGKFQFMGFTFCKVTELG